MNKNNKKYDKYKDSGIEWIGKIPQDWDLEPLKLHAKIFGRIGFRGYTQEDLVDEGEGAITLSPTNIVGNNLTLEKCQYLSWNKYYESPEIILNKGDIVFVKTASVGKCAIYSSDKLATINPQFVVFKDVVCNNKYLFYMLLSEVIQTPIMLSNLGSVVGTIKQTELASYKIPIPKQEEQQKIADFLDKKCGDIDNAIETEKNVIENLKEYKQSVITEAVTKGLDKSVELKDSGIQWIGRIPKHWEVKRTKYTANSFDKGNGITKEDIVLDGDIRCIRYGEIYSKYDGQCIECVSATNLNKISSPKYISTGEILFAGTGELIEEIGKNIVYMGDKPCLAGGDIIILNHNQNPIFLNYALNSIYSQSQKSYGKVKLKVVHISASAIGNIRIAIPPKEEQQQIAEYLDKKCSQIDETITKKEELIEKLTEYKKSLIYECVTGKRRIVND